LTRSNPANRQGNVRGANEQSKVEAAMNAFVVYGSMFGNTERIARAIGSALADHGPTEVRPVAQAETIPPGTDLLVIGGPTQGHGMDKTMKAYLDRLPAGSVSGVAVAAFDTRLKWPVMLSGSAARSIAKQLGRKGGRLLVEPGSFIVEGKEGPLAEGELERASSWAEDLAGAAERTG
jgi:flavodoxin